MTENVQVIYEQLYKPLLNFTTGFCLDRDLAEHVVADVFSELLKKQEPPEDLRRWLFSTAKHLTIDYYYQIKRWDSVEYTKDTQDSLDLRPVEEEALERITYEEQIRKVLPLLEKLKPHQRHAMRLRLVEDCSSREIGEMMNLTEERAKAIFRGAVLKIRNHLKLPVNLSEHQAGTCSYGACTKKIFSRYGFCKKHLRIKQAAAVRRNDRKRHGWH